MIKIEFDLNIIILLFGTLAIVYSTSTDDSIVNSDKSKDSDEWWNTDPACQPHQPNVPNFKTPGRRVSEAKCYEYIWNIKYRMDEELRAKKCMSHIQHLYIIGGQQTAAGDFPHMGAIGWKAVHGTWIFNCGGTLISPKFLLTAAHCTRASSQDTTLADVVPKIVRLGDKNILDKPVNYSFSNTEKPIDEKIIRILKHPGYASPKKYYDIALIEFENEVVFSKNLQPACLWTNPDDNAYKGQASVTGWGVIRADRPTTSPDLQAAIVDMIDRKTCDDLLRPACNRLFCGLQDHQLCAGKLKGGVDTCQGDSGGPLQVEITLPTTVKGKMYYVIGVTSFGKGCARANTPGVYTKVASFLDWIESIVWA